MTTFAEMAYLLTRPTAMDNLIAVLRAWNELTLDDHWYPTLYFLLKHGGLSYTEIEQMDGPALDDYAPFVQAQLEREHQAQQAMFNQAKSGRL